MSQDFSGAGMRMVRWMTVAALSLSLRAGAQASQIDSGQVTEVQTQPQREPSTGSVTGVVIAQDTERPARFVQVQLQSVASVEGNGGGQGRFGSFGGGSVNVRTDVDGMFMATHVGAGDYYVTAVAPGYISERALLQAAVAAGSDPAGLLRALPVVRVTANSTSNITVTMQRGGVIAGHVEWEDGSPASGVSMNATSTLATATLPAALRGFQSFGGGTPYAQTDDRGNFRIADLASGDYLLSATVQAGSQQGGAGRLPGYVSPIRVYAPGVFRKGEAKAISVRAGDERTDARMVIDLRGLHGVSGHVNSSNAGQSVATGGVHLMDSSDSTLQLQAQIDADGGFKLRYVPPGTYTLRITGANSQAPTFGRRGGADATPGVAYQEFTTTVTVGDTDVTGLALSLVPVQSQK